MNVFNLLQKCWVIDFTLLIWQETWKFSENLTFLDDFLNPQIPLARKTQTLKKIRKFTKWYFSFYQNYPVDLSPKPQNSLKKSCFFQFFNEINSDELGPGGGHESRHLLRRGLHSDNYPFAFQRNSHLRSNAKQPGNSGICHHTK